MTRQNRSKFSRSHGGLAGVGLLVVGLPAPLAAQPHQDRYDDDWRGVIGTALVLAHANDHGHRNNHYRGRDNHYYAHAYRGHPGNHHYSHKQWRKHQKRQARRHAQRYDDHHQARRHDNRHYDQRRGDGGRHDGRRNDDRRHDRHRNG